MRDYDTIYILLFMEELFAKNTLLLTIKSQRANHSSLLRVMLSGSDTKIAHSSKDNGYNDTCRTESMEKDISNIFYNKC